MYGRFYISFWLNKIIACYWLSTSGSVLWRPTAFILKYGIRPAEPQGHVSRPGRAVLLNARHWNFYRMSLYHFPTCPHVLYFIRVCVRATPGTSRLSRWAYLIPGRHICFDRAWPETRIYPFCNGEEVYTQESRFSIFLCHLYDFDPCVPD